MIGAWLARSTWNPSEVSCASTCVSRFWSCSSNRGASWMNCPIEVASDADAWTTTASSRATIAR